MSATRTAAQMKKDLLADFTKREQGKKFYKEDLADYKQHLASRTADQLRWCYSSMLNRTSSVARERDMKLQNKLVASPGFMNMRAA